MRDLYEAAWLKSNRPYFLRNNLEHYDYTIQLWIAAATNYAPPNANTPKPKPSPQPPTSAYPPHPPATPFYRPPYV